MAYCTVRILDVHAARVTSGDCLATVLEDGKAQQLSEVATDSCSKAAVNAARLSFSAALCCDFFWVSQSSLAVSRSANEHSINMLPLQTKYIGAPRKLTALL